ncbi:hypothetical protein ACFV99_23440 [Streptomyces sp. NPDC059944]|uniref:hypothetical protein n=1 Tax=unclassified Streptomyces TaxID=2593676 RepID=UPI003646B93E
MRLYLVIPSVLLALLLVVSGVAAVTRGWVLPWNRRRVRAPRVYGWGQLVVAFALCWQAAFGLVIGDSDVRPVGTLIGSGILLSGILLSGIIVMLVSQSVGAGQRARGDVGQHGTVG